MENMAEKGLKAGTENLEFLARFHRQSSAFFMAPIGDSKQRIFQADAWPQIREKQSFQRMSRWAFFHLQSPSLWPEYPGIWRARWGPFPAFLDGSEEGDPGFWWLFACEKDRALSASLTRQKRSFLAASSNEERKSLERPPLWEVLRRRPGFPIFCCPDLGH